jgi:hypothetical protein
MNKYIIVFPDLIDGLAPSSEDIFDVKVVKKRSEILSPENQTHGCKLGIRHVLP